MGFSILPKATHFYDLFARAGENVLAVAQLVEKRFADPSAVPHSEIKKLEHIGDDMTGETIQLLNTQYVTPFDREDIYGLASATDDVVDHIDHASELLDVYRLGETTEQARRQCQILVGAAGHLAAALGSLRGLAEADSHLLELKKFEDEGDRIVREAIGGLFSDPDPDPLYVIRWKDVYDALEDAIDACERAALHVGNIVVKNG
jgi:uncharacterized protein Yka (UPF0111/DUF47 family)